MGEQDTRMRLAAQIAAARRGRRWRLSDLAKRTGRNQGRLSEMETGRANSTVSSLAETGEALGLTLLFVPDDKLDQVLDLIGQPRPAPVTRNVPTVLEELFVSPEPDPEDDDEPNP